MARIRTIKPVFWQSPTIARLPHRARLTFIGLWNYVDDDGRGYDDSRLIKAAVWPLDDDVTPAEVSLDLAAIEELQLIERWRDENLARDVLRVRGFSEHQVVNKRSKSRIAPSPGESGSTTGALPETDVPAPVPVSDDSLPEVEVEVEVEEGEESDVAAPDNTVPEDYLAQARSLVIAKPDEADEVIALLVQQHGEMAVCCSITTLKDRKFQWASELKTAVEAELQQWKALTSPSCTPGGAPSDRDRLLSRLHELERRASLVDGVDREETLALVERVREEISALEVA